MAQQREEERRTVLGERQDDVEPFAELAVVRRVRVLQGRALGRLQPCQASDLRAVCGMREGEVARTASVKISFFSTYSH